MLNSKKIEEKWQKYWEENKTFKTDAYDFSKFAILLWTLLVVAILLPIFLFIVLNHFSKKKKKNNNPRFIVNK